MAVSRGEAQQGQIVRLGIRFTLGGSAIDPFEIRQVEVTDQDGQVLQTFTGALIVHDGTGLFHVDWAIPGGEPVTIHYDKWYATALSGGSEEVFTQAFQVLALSTTNPSTPYITTARARLYLGDTALSDLEIAENVLLGQQVIERITGRWFLPRTMVRTFDGSGLPVLSLDHSIMSVAEVRILGCGSGDDQTIDPTIVRITKAGRMIGLGNVQRFSHRFAEYGDPYPRPFIGAGHCGVFPSGFMNIQITGDWGDFLEVPLDIERALGALLRYTGVCDDPLGSPFAAHKSEDTNGDRQYTMRDIWNSSITQNATGYPDVDAILSGYKEDFFVDVV